MKSNHLVLSRLAALWSRLTEPLPSVQDDDIRQEARLLTSLLFSSLLVTVILVPLPLVLSSIPVMRDPSLLIGVSGSGFIALMMAFSRRGYILPVVLLVVVGGTGLIFLHALAGDRYAALMELHFPVTLVIFGSMFLRTRILTLICAGQIVGMFALLSGLPGVTVAELLRGPVNFTLFAGLLTVLIAHYRYVAETKRRARLSESELRYRIISDLISDYAYVYRIDPDGQMEREWITLSAFQRLTGYTTEELARIGRAGLAHPDDLPHITREVARTIQGEVTESEHRIITKSGDVRWIHVIRHPIWDAVEGRVVRYYGVVQDITERRLAEEAIRQSEERYRALSEVMSDYIYAFMITRKPDGTPEAKLEWITGAYERITGYTIEDALQGRGWAKHIYPDDKPRLQARLERLMSGEPDVTDIRIYNKAGQLVWIELHGVPVWNDDGRQVARFFGGAKDITERKQSEEQQFRLAVEKERLRMVSQFVLAISHDFRNVLATIETNRYLVEQQLDTGAREKVNPRLQNIHDLVMHMGEQLGNLHMVSSLVDLTPNACDINQLVSEIIGERRLQADQKQLKLSSATPDKPLELTLDVEKVKTALLHLLDNAIAHTDGGGSVSVSIQKEPQGVSIEVRDTGRGIEANDLPHIFEPFYRADLARTINAGGIGLGLSIVKIIVEAHGGSIQVQSVPGAGSAFIIALPTHTGSLLTT